MIGHAWAQPTFHIDHSANAQAALPNRYKADKDVHFAVLTI